LHVSGGTVQQKPDTVVGTACRGKAIPADKTHDAKTSVFS
jgi:hypothetical protein